MLLDDPGPCPVCDAPHTGCTATTGAIAIPQLPERDASAAAVLPPLQAEIVQATLPPDEFTTGTYRGTRPIAAGRPRR